MSINTSNPNYLLNLFKEDVKSRLVKIGIDAVRPHIEEAAETAVASMNAMLQSHYNNMGETVVQLLIRGDNR